MRKWLVAGTILTAACLHVSAQTGSPQPSKYLTTFQAVWQDVHDKFYDPGFLGVNWDEVGQRYRMRLTGIRDDTAFENLINDMLRQLPTTHLHFRPPSASAVTGIGVLTREIEGKSMVTDVWYASDAMRRGVHDGDVILTGRDQLRGLWGSAAQVQIQKCDGEQETLTIRREPYGWPFERPSVRWKLIQQSPKMRVGYIQITHFEDDVAPLTDQAMRDLEDTSGIIIDVRNNSGGNASYVRLLSYLTPGTHMAFALLSRPFLNQFGRAPEKMDQAMISRLPKVTGAYTTQQIIDAFRKNGGGAAFYTEDVGPHVYHGRIVVLINHETASAAEGFVWTLKGKPGVSIVGQPTAGAVVGAEDFPIPGGWKLTVPTHAAWTSDGTIYRDQKSIPDISIPLRQEDLCAETDSTLNQALDSLAH